MSEIAAAEGTLRNLALLLVMVTIGLVVWGGKRASVAPLLTVTWVIHVVLWCALPLFLQHDLSDPVANSAGPMSRGALSLLHATSLLALALLFLAFPKPYLAPVKRFFDAAAPAPKSLLWPTVISLVAMLVIERALNRLSGTSFNDSVAFVVTADAGQMAQSGLIGVALTLVLGYSIAVISLGRNGGVSTLTLCAAWTSCLVFSAFAMMRGSRAGVLLPVVAGIIALATLHGRARRRATIVVVVGGLITGIVGAPVAAVMGYARGTTAPLSVDMVNDAIVTVLGGTSPTDRLRLVATEVNRKFDAVGPGIELLAMEPPGTGGVMPILSATLSPVPRFLYLSKPVPTSRDGTYFGSPYRIAAKAYGDPATGMVMPVSASAIGLWEFGWLGPLVLVVLNLVSLVLLNTVCVSSNVFTRALGISTLNLPSAEFFIAPPSSVVQFSLRLALLTCVVALVILALRAVTKADPRVRAAVMA